MYTQVVKIEKFPFLKTKETNRGNENMNDEVIKDEIRNNESSKINEIQINQV